MIKNSFKKLVLMLVLAGAGHPLFSQLVVDNTPTPTFMVNNVLLGTGVTSSGITYSGYPEARGTFDGTMSNIGFPAGIMLGSGDINAGPGPNSSGSSTLGGSSVMSFDPDLSAIASGQLYDAAILEFDFVPQNDTLKFRYVFASEEYPEYVCSSFNDVFGFFLSGPNPAGGSYTNQNVAIIPGSGGLPVAINTVNPGVAGSSGMPGGCTSLAYSSLYFDNLSPGLTVEYDGFTVPLTAIAPVVCGATYHIKIAIADVGDGAFDSGVFLEAGSFSSEGIEIIPEISYGGSNDSTLYEGCGLACIYFIRYANIADADTVAITIGGTATNGVDYNTGIPGSLLPDTLYFAAGQDSVQYCINAVDDTTFVEGEETVDLTYILYGPCSNDTTVVTLYLTEHTPIMVSMNDTTICPGSSTVLNPVVSGGVEPYLYLWSGGLPPGPNPTASPSSTTSYVLTLNDACFGSPDPTPSVMDTVTVNVIHAAVVSVAPPTLSMPTASGDLSEGCGTACFYFVRTSDLSYTDTVPLTVAGTAINGVDYNIGTVGSTFPSSLIFTPGVDSIQICVSAVLDVPVEGTESVSITVIPPAICALPPVTASVDIADLQPLVVTTTSDTICEGASAVLTTTVTGGIQPYTYTWTGGLPAVANPTVTPAATTSYIISVSDACGGSPDPTPAVADTATVTVIHVPVVSISAPVVTPPTPGSVLYEGCGTACFYFIRTSNLSYTDTVPLTITGLAVNGTDYNTGSVGSTVPSQLIFAPGVDSIVICLTGVFDGVAEGPESINFGITQTGLCAPAPVATTLNVSDIPPFNMTVSDTSYCNPGGTTLITTTVTGGLGPYTYAWSGGLAPTANQTVPVTATTTYTVTVTDACSNSPDPTPAAIDTATVFVLVTQPLALSSDDNMLVCPGDVINLSSTTTGGATPYNYSWITIIGTDTVLYPYAANTSFVAESGGTFQVTVVDYCGNVQNETVTVTVEESCELNIPNIITPDGSGPLANEFFYIENLERFPRSSLKIYNRWGNKIYETEDYRNDWSGGGQNDGTYFYILTVPTAGVVQASANKPSMAGNSFKESALETNKVFTGFFQLNTLK